MSEFFGLVSQQLNLKEFTGRPQDWDTWKFSFTIAIDALGASAVLHDDKDASKSTSRRLRPQPVGATRPQVLASPLHELQQKKQAADMVKKENGKEVKISFLGLPHPASMWSMLINQFEKNTALHILDLQEVLQPFHGSIHPVLRLCREHRALLSSPGGPWRGTV